MVKAKDSLIFSDEILSKLKNYFSEKGFLLVYLFGSQAGENIGPLSDFDIAILTIQSPEPRSIYTFVHNFSKIIGTNRIDVVSLNDAPVELQFRIIRQGVILYQKSNHIRVEFEANTLSRYFDFLPILLRQRNEILMEGKDEKGIQRNLKSLERLSECLKKLEPLRTCPNDDFEKDPYLDDLYAFADYIKHWIRKRID
jgi:predicted nucleotidyltransferase